MASPARGKDEQVASSLAALKLEGAKESTKPSKEKKKNQVADSWEDQDSSPSDDDAETPTKASFPSPPPPTPATPHFTSAPDWSAMPEPGTASPLEVPASRRPEKTDAVARRMIAAGLGLRAPRQTEEQQAYQKSIREQERKKMEQEKADERKRREDAEKAKAAVWDD
ncbi:Uncharacterized protein TCAP_00325 [Tolypocladium capitatum]|uniref:Ubiquitin-like protein smt3 n=1 Tax=Tolypocladium capitatum TaxID=45235 RepID=A0A2K3QQE8_9HYPO|nr:Uncharacterized protein TCAP_00325 [Tolypocladium capitatum]